jgi:hypothetical protein
MKKTVMKKLGITLLVLTAIFFGTLFWLHGNLDGLLADAIAKYGSEMTQAKISVGGVQLNATNGEGVIRDLTIKNPKGFKTEHAFSVKEFAIVIDPASLAGDVVLVKKIAIIAPDVIYEKGDTMTNFDAIQKNIADYLGPSKGTTSSKKLIVEELTIRNIKAQASAPFMGGKTMTVAVPDLTLRKLGKSKGGITPGELGQIVSDAMKKQLAGSISFNTLSNVISGTASGAVNSAKDAVGKALSLF